MKIKKKSFLLLVCVLFVTLSTVYFLSTFLPKKGNGVQKQPSSTAVGCNRTTRLDNQPQYDRALSLIAQRLENTNKYSNEEDKFKYFPPSLTNCIVVKEANLKGQEGFFVINSKEARNNYFPITVDTSYNLTDDASTALLLVHEMTHVQQYIDSVNGKTKLSCIDDEVNAFISQLDFYTTLNTEENKSIWLRMQEKTNLQPQIKMLKDMIQINQNRPNSVCGGIFGDAKCTHTYLSDNLRKAISEDPDYKKECNIK